MMANYERLFGELPKKHTKVLEPKDQPELDQTTILDSTGLKQYQSLIGALQWCVTL